MGDEIETTAGAADAPQTDARAARRARPATPAAADAPAADTTSDDGDRQIVHPASFMVDRVDVGDVQIPREGIEVDRAEAERLVEAAGKADGRNVLRRHKA